MQQTLRELDDAVTAVAFTDQLGEGMRSHLAPAIGALSKLDRSPDDRVRDLNEQWHAFREEPGFWG